MKKYISSIMTSVRVGFFLALRDIKRANIWTTTLIIFVMTLTFLNLIVIRGILVGLTQGSVAAYRDRYTGTVFLRPLDQKQFIEDSHLPVGILNNIAVVQAVSQRYTGAGTIEADYRKVVVRDEEKDKASAVVVGIDPEAEEKVTGLSTKLIAGSYLQRSMKDSVLVGSSLLSTYSAAQGVGTSTLKNANIGSVIRLTVNNSVREVTIVGVVKAKVQTIDSRVFMLDSDLRPMLGRDDFNVNEIAVKTRSSDDDLVVKSVLLGNGVDALATVETWAEAQPQFIRDISATFSLLGDVIGSIGLAVASITIFIVIFVNAITRRKFIGILKGIGIEGLAIEFSYMFQSLFYAASGSAAGLAIVYGLIVPYFSGNPIDFPFSDGIFVADIGSVSVRVVILMIATIIAGFVPARLVVKQRTLDAILGR